MPSRATHRRAVEEVLGDGDGPVERQSHAHDLIEGAVHHSGPARVARASHVSLSPFLHLRFLTQQGPHDLPGLSNTSGVFGNEQYWAERDALVNR